MSTPILPSLQIARLLWRKGDIHEARMSAEDARYDSLILEDRLQWLESTTLYFQCCQELEELPFAQKPLEQVLAYLETNPEIHLQAQAQTLISSWLLAQGKIEEAQDYVQSAINKAMQCRDLTVLARALSVFAFSLSMEAKNEGRALEQLNKLDTILSEITQPDLQLTADVLRSYLYTQKAQFDLALPLLWRCYENAKLQGFNLIVSSILAQLARVYREQNQTEEFHLYADLAMKGIDKNKTPRLYKMILQICPAVGATYKKTFDFIIDEKARRVREKTKGSIDFKNQHILFEMALMFIKNPGTRYNKDDLARIIWNQGYEPDLHDNLIYVSIKRLRTLIEPDLESPRYILRDRKGYYFNPQALVQFKNSEKTNATTPDTTTNEVKL